MRVEYVAKGIETIQTAARQGRIIAFTMGMGKVKQTKMGIDEARAKINDDSRLQQRFKYALAVFLICAEKYSYFLPHDGYGVDRGASRLWMKELPEFSRPLGAPKGPAVKTGWTYRRDFEHASVMVDIKNEVAEIDWK